jgi:acetate kinase
MIVVINCGSSSVKLDVFDAHGEDNPLQAQVERVGTDQAKMTVEVRGEAPHQRLLGQADHDAAVSALLDVVMSRGDPIQAVGHRVVHGGEQLTRSMIITTEVMAAIERCVPLAPLHNPANLQGIRAVTARLPQVPQVAVFDTAFHATLPAAAYLYAIPRRYHREHGMRRYGFHGTSHRYVADQAALLLGQPITSLKMVTLHLGNGCSACAVDGGISVDTTMGMTPLEGLVMGTRAGDVDAAVVLQLARLVGIDGAERLLNKDSGLLGVSGLSSDMRDLLARRDAGHQDAGVAIAVFVHRVRKAVGALACAMGGVDAIVFTGGMGEHAAAIRAEVCAGLTFLGAAIDVAANQQKSRTNRDVASSGSRVRVVVVATDEEKAIAQQTAQLLTQP